MELSIIAAVGAENFAIGKGGKQPFYYQEDQVQFRNLTTRAGCVIMGRKTWESIHRPLENRKNIVISKNENGQINGDAWVLESLGRCMTWLCLSGLGSTNPFVIGGVQLYQEAMELDCCKTAWITRVPNVVQDADTFFPEATLQQYFKLESEKIVGLLNFQKWVRK